MNVFVVYCHPSNSSFTYMAKECFLQGLEDAGHEYEISELYQMGFETDLSEDQYNREAFYRRDIPLPYDVLLEQEKINNADAIVFIYPVFWTEAPAKLVGWFQRVWSYGFAYGDNRKMKMLDKALFMITMGGSLEDEIRQKQVEAMKTVMIGDRMNNRVKKCKMIVFDRMTRINGGADRDARMKAFLQQAYNAGRMM